MAVLYEDAPQRQGPGKIKLVWFLVFTTIGLALALAVSFSCSTVATSTLYLYSIRPAGLIQRLENASNSTVRGDTDASFNNTNAILNADATDFGLANFPDRYLFGVSGLCRHWDQSGETECRRHFPQVPSILAAVLEDSDAEPIREAWTRILASTNISPQEKASEWKTYITAAAGLLITSILWSILTLIFTTTFTALKRDHLRWSVFLSSVDAVMALAAVVLWTIVIHHQNSAIGSAAPDLSDSAPDQVQVGPGFYLLWVLTWCKAMVTPIMMLIFLVVGVVMPVLCCLQCCEDAPVPVRIVESEGFPVPQGY